MALAAWAVALVGVRAGGPPDTAAAPMTVEKASAPVKSAQTQAPAQSAGAFVGQDTCLGCHDVMRKGYERSAHDDKVDTRTPGSKQGCESCHGAGGKHVEDPAANPLVRFSKAAPDQVNQACTTCHSRDAHALWDGSQHERRGVSCASCHSIHNPKSEKAMLKAEYQPDVCSSCHRDKLSKLDRSGHMPVREGKMTCSSCHNVHGTTNVRLLAKGDSVTESCTSCHAEKRGPYLWEHAPVREGCTTCHDPHGSANERMLVSKPPLLCQRCHVHTRHPSTIYDATLIGPNSPVPSVRVYGRSCVTCHPAIHGSNHPSGQRFVR
jgi:DmsE family decaheme c-type cytochrome